MLKKNAKEIITNEEKLSIRADEVDTAKGMNEAREIISDLKNTIRATNAKSLSAPAIGYEKRIICINFTNSEIKTFINPIIMSAEGMVLSEETSCVLPNKRFLVPRNNTVNIMYTRPTGSIESNKLSGVAAAVFQQEINLLDGILVSDIGLEIDEQWDNATQEEREEVVNAYLDSLDLTAKEIDKEIQSDKELKEISDAIDFAAQVEEGKIEMIGITAEEDGKLHKENN